MWWKCGQDHTGLPHRRGRDSTALLLGGGRATTTPWRQRWGQSSIHVVGTQVRLGVDRGKFFPMTRGRLLDQDCSSSLIPINSISYRTPDSRWASLQKPTWAGMDITWEAGTSDLGDPLP